MELWLLAPWIVYSTKSLIPDECYEMFPGPPPQRCTPSPHPASSSPCSWWGGSSSGPGTFSTPPHTEALSDDTNK